MANLKATLFILSAFNIVIGAALWFVPGNTADALGITGSSAGFVFSIAGAAFIASALMFSFTAYDPLNNVNGVRFAILWNALMVIATVYAIAKEYVTWEHTWFIVAINTVLFIAMAVFYPRQRQA